MKVMSTAIEIEGPDKTAKDTIAKYIEQLGNYKYNINVRGVLTQLVYNDKFNRNNSYVFMHKPIIVLLSAEDEDIEIRCRSTKEPKYNSAKDREVYEYYAKTLEINNMAIVWRYNTSEMTPYRIGKDIIKKLESIDYNDLATPHLELDSLNQYTKDDLKNEDVYYGPLDNSNNQGPDLSQPEYIVGGDLSSVIYYDSEIMKPLHRGYIPKHVFSVPKRASNKKKENK